MNSRYKISLALSLASSVVFLGSITGCEADLPKTQPVRDCSKEISGMMEKIEEVRKNANNNSMIGISEGERGAMVNWNGKDNPVIWTTTKTIAESNNQNKTIFSFSNSYTYLADSESDCNDMSLGVDAVLAESLGPLSDATGVTWSMERNSVTGAPVATAYACTYGVTALMMYTCP